MTDPQPAGTALTVATVQPTQTANPGDTGGTRDRPEFTPEQEKAIGRLLAKEREAARSAALAAAEQERAAAAEQARKDREADDAKKRGEFDKVEQALRGDLTAAKTEAGSLKAENEQLREAVNRVLDDEWKALSAEARDAYAAAGGSEDDPLARLRYLPAGKKLSPRADPARGNGSDPRPAGAAGPPSLSQTTDEFRRMHGIRR
ncbi:MAG: hypothetical protein M3Q74_00920 [Pseudomonadota bacterium]|nr:hypothetical protein [Pseudomonadota bacterium]